jgi:HTH-type transcriptional regulator, sugar sensing transcriptional regulator
MKTEGRIQTLTDLGLTLDQAKLYLALLQGGPATARQLATTSKIARPDIYRIIPTIEKQGMVEKLMTKPISYQAVPAVMVLPNIIKQKATEQKLLIKETEELLDDLKNNPVREIQEANTDSVMVYGKEAIIQRLKASLAKANENLSMVVLAERCSDVIFDFAYDFRKSLRRGVKINIITEQHIQRKKALVICERLSTDLNFKVRFTSSPLPAIVTVIDDKEAFITMASGASLPNISALWSKNPSLVSLAQNYFECTWNNAS